MKEQLQNLILPFILLAGAIVIGVAILWNGVVPPAGVQGVGNAGRFGVEQGLSVQEVSLVEYFDGLAGERERILDGRNPFYTAFIEPEPDPEPDPDPEPEPDPDPEPEPDPDPEPEPPVPPREIEILYTGFLRGSQGVFHAYVVKDGSTLIGGEGMDVADGWRIAEFDAHRLILVDNTGETFEVAFNQRRILEIPVEPDK